MKKILFIVVCLFIFNLQIYAETYYGDYYLVGHEEMDLSDVVKKEEIKLYNTYKLEKIDMGYMLENDLYNKDLNDFKEEFVFNDIYNKDTEEEVSLNVINEEVDKIRRNRSFL